MALRAALAALLFSLPSKAVLVDKIAAVMDGHIITLSEVKRIRETLPNRRNILPQIYNKKKLSLKAIITIKLKSLVIRKQLHKAGYTVSDEEIEKTIEAREKALGVNRKQLKDVLKKNNLLFDEYFHITREALEFSRFHSWVIRPLVTITEQEVKNAFYRERIHDKTLSFRYELVDFFLPRSSLKKKALKELPKVVENFHGTGFLPPAFAGLQTQNLGKITEEGLEKRLKKLLKHTPEGGFTKNYRKEGHIHVFYVKKKDVVESEIFQREKQRIQEALFQASVQKTTALWFETKKNDHYVKIFL